MNFRNKKIKALSIFMSLLMLLSVITPAVSATELDKHEHHEGHEEKGEINYVSLGDSMTNGYGLPGYQLNSGVETYGNDSYANKFAEWLEDAGCADKVNHAQLAMSGMRVEDIHWLLELDYNDENAIAVIEELIERNDEWADGSEECEALWNSTFTSGDFWTLDEICNHARTDATFLFIYGGTNYDYPTKKDEHGNTVDNIVKGAIEDIEGFEYPTTFDKTANMAYGKNRAMKVALIAKYYQDMVSDADLISIGVGNGNLGVFGFGRILDVVGFNSSSVVGTAIYKVESAIRELDPATQDLILNLKEELMANVAGVMPEGYGDNEILSQLADVAVYIGLSMVLNYMGTYDAIIAMNPDVELMQVGIMNTFAEEGESEGVSIGTLMDVVVTPMNAFLAAYPTYKQLADEDYADAKFYYAEAEFIECMVAVYGQDFYLEDGSTPNPDSIIRDRFVESIVGYYKDGKTWVNGTVWGLLSGVTFSGKSLVPVTFEEIMAYEQMSVMEKIGYATAEEGKYQDKIVSISVYLAVEKAIIESKDASVALTAILGLGGLDDSLFAPVFAEFANIMTNCDDETAAVVYKIIADQSGDMLDPDVVGTLVTGYKSAKNNTWAAYREILTDAETYNHANMDECLACEEESHNDEDSICKIARDKYYALVNDVKCQAVAAIAFDMSNGMLDADDIKFLVSENFTNDACYELIADKAFELMGIDLDTSFIKTVYEKGIEVSAQMQVINGMVDQPIPAQLAALVDDCEVHKDADLATWVSDMLLDESVDGCTNCKTIYSSYFAATFEGFCDEAENTLVEMGVDQIIDMTDMLIDNLYVLSGGYYSLDTAVEGANALFTLLGLPTNLSVALQSDETVAGLLGLMGRCMIGNGLGAHPSAAGHNALFEAVKKAYAEDHTAQDETVKNILILLDLVKEYYDDAYAYAYAQAVEDGTIAGIIASIEEVKGHIADAEAWIANNSEYIRSEEFAAQLTILVGEAYQTVDAIVAIIEEADYLDADTNAKVVALLNQLGEDVEALASLLGIAVIDGGHYLDPKIEAMNAQAEKQIGIVIDQANKQIEILNAQAEKQLAILNEQLMNAVGEAEAAIRAEIERVEKALEDAIEEINTHVENEIAAIQQNLKDAIEALETNYYNAVEELKGIIDDLNSDVAGHIVSAAIAVADIAIKANDYFKANYPEEYAKLVDMIQEAVVKFAPELDMYLYNWFYENPDKVIAFFEAYGDDMIEFLVENKEIILPIIAYVAYYFGSEAVEFVMNNPETALKAMVNWYEKYGDRVWDLIDVYLETLGVELDVLTPDQIIAAITNIFNLISEFGGQFAEIAWDKLVEYGVIDEILNTLDEIKMEAWEQLVYLENVVRAHVLEQIDNLKAEADRLNGELQNAIEDLKNQAHSQIEIVVNQANKQIEILNGQIIALRDQAHAQIAILEKQLETAVGEAKDAIEAEIARINAELKAAVEAIEAEIARSNAELKATVDAIDATLNAQIQALKNQYAVVIDAINSAIAKIEATLDEIDALILEIKVVVNEIIATIEKIDATISEIIAAIESGMAKDQLFAILKDAFLELGDALIDLIDTAALLEQLDTALKILVTEGFDALVEHLKAVGNEVANDAAEALKNVIDSAIVELTPIVKPQIEILVAKINAAINLYINDALNGEYTVSVDSDYVAIGDNAYYADILANALGLSAEQLDKMGWNDIDFVEIMGADLITVGYDESNISAFAINQLLGYAAEYINGDLRGTVNEYANNAFATFLTNLDLLEDEAIPAYVAMLTAYANGAVDELLANELLAGKTTTAMDWVALVGEDNVSYIEKARAELRAELLGAGVPETVKVEINVVDMLYKNIDTMGDDFAFLKTFSKDKLAAKFGEYATFTVEIPVVDTLIFSAESYLYSYVNFNHKYFETILAIQAINPTAQIVVLGGYNAFDGVTFDLGATSVNLGDLYGYLVDATSTHSFVYSLAYANVTYVDISETETAYEAAVAAGQIDADLETFLMAYLSNPVILGASAQGNYYIAAQILNALTITCEHAYDNDCDADCNFCGETREVADHIYDNACDTDCNVCGGERVPAEHVYDDACDADCNVCGETRGVGEHVYDNACDATCNECGATREVADHVYDNDCDATCNECNAEREVGEHVYDNDCDATCNICNAEREVGEHVYYNDCDATCNICNAEREVGEHVYDNDCDATCNVCENIRVPADHDYNDATCTAPATCKVCGATAGSALGHNYSDATCEAPATCTRCDATTGEALGHSWVDATCEAPKTCTVCNKTEGEALGHSWTDATCTAPTTCTTCNATAGSALGHNYSEATCEVPATCTRCDATTGEALGHSWVDATCEAPKTCTVCNKTEGEALGHNWTDATCVAAKTCTVCNKTEGEALGHKYDNACDAACNACDATRTPAAHVYGEWSVVKDATATEDGERQHTCTECGNVESEVIPALGETEEKTPVGVVIAIVVASTAGTAGIVFAGYWLVIKKKFITFGKK